MIMKQKFYVFGSLLCLLLTGCSPKIDTSYSLNLESTTLFAEDSYLSFGQTCFSNNGYFYYDNSGINFVDLGNMKNYSLDHHQTNDIGDQYMSNIGLVWFYDDHIGYSKIGENGGYLSFYECNIDGANEIELARFNGDTSIIAGTSRKGIIYQDTMYLSIQLIGLSSSSYSEVLCSVDMKTGKIKELTPFIKSDGSGIELCFVYEDALFFITKSNLESDEFTDYYNLYKYNLNDLSITLLRDDLASVFSVSYLPTSQYVYYASSTEDGARNGEALEFYQYDIENNEITLKSFAYPLNDDESMWLGSSFDDFVQVRIMDDEGTYMDTIFYHPLTGEIEYYKQNEYFIPYYKNDMYILGYTYDSSEEYLFSLLTIDEFNSREFDKAIKVTK